MRQARILQNDVVQSVTIQDQQPAIAGQFTWLPATNGSVIGLALNNRPLMDKLAPELTEAPYKNPPKTPVYFFKPVNTHLAHQGAIQIPANGETAFAGAALGIVIGSTARKVKRADAASVIAGYTIVNEVSLAETSYYRPAIKAKCRDTFCPIGPWVVSADELDVSALAINTYVNGELRQRGNTADLIYSVPEIIEYLSDFMTLQAGDLIIAGTTLREVALAAGDVVAVEIEGIGRLENTVTLETGAAK
ncbi:fumarylacetoacetate hydrolase family protein [Leeia sp. TBRC 13508]|uniref:Fumarylacetoacetate hydrolase family protein n=1 Tax=Leeia speluncae TaxID=2884804 RepID=A0ABS8D9Z3_9NEIS|nr:fumarylacetoacetate hydrolase family protein [Leeia speluncae]MCB6184952.1 fumarylacetoacetate hydrolase family protein [Leeia speluncae]